MLDHLIELASGIIPSIIGLFNGKTSGQQKFKKLKNGTEIPTPFPCASHHAEECVRISENFDIYKIAVTFTPENLNIEPPEFVSAVIQYPYAYNVRRFNHIKLDIRFTDGDFHKIWLELHAEDGDEKLIWKMDIPFDTEWKTYTIPLKTAQLTRITGSLREIDFVVHRSFVPARSMAEQKGGGCFEIKGLQLVK